MDLSNKLVVGLINNHLEQAWNLVGTLHITPGQKLAVAEAIQSFRDALSDEHARPECPKSLPALPPLQHAPTDITNS